MFDEFELLDQRIKDKFTDIDERFPVAYASIIVDEEDGKKIGKLVGMLRRDEYSGMGICKDMVLKRIDICKAIGCSEIYTAVYHKREGLIRLYKELGFKEIEPITPKYRRFVLGL